MSRSKRNVTRSRKSVFQSFGVETCAGLGALGLGAQYAGWQVVAQNDINEKFTEHQTRYGKIPVVTGDVADMKTVSALHHAHSTSGTIAFVFPCQPYSTAGDQKHGLDPRSDSLPAGLYASHLRPATQEGLATYLRYLWS